MPALSQHAVMEYGTSSFHSGNINQILQNTNRNGMKNGGNKNERFKTKIDWDGISYKNCAGQDL